MNGRQTLHLAGAAFFATAALLVAKDTMASDEQGQFAIRGAGLINCALYSRERVAGRDVSLITAAWADGYITGINQYAVETYDLLSFETTELLMAILDEHCQSNPDDPVFGVLTKLFEQLWADRLTEKSEMTTIALADREARHYVQFIERAQARLQEEGFYGGPISGEFTAMMVEAVKQYQASVGLNATGFPDQLTLWRLMRSEPGADL